MPTLNLHGTPHLRRDDGTDLALSAREAALLAWLHLQGPTPRARLAALLWPQGSAAQARANLRQTLARLKRAAGAVWLEDGGVLRLQLPVADADGQPLLGPLQFDDADELQRWLDDRRLAAQRERQRDARAALQALLAAGRLDEALAASDTLLAADPESEEAWRLRMELFYLRGDRAAALAAWDDCRHALRQAFGVAPSAATNELGRLILSADAPPPAPAPAPGALPPALRRPPQLVGRHAVLADIERCLQLGHAVVLAGAGGLGKSRLLQELSQRHAGTLYVAARAGDALAPGSLLGRLLQRVLAAWPAAADDGCRQQLAPLLPGAAAALPSASEHHLALQAAAQALRTAHAQGLQVLLLDDLHAADDASLAALQWLASRPPPALPVVLGLRPDELSSAGQALLAQGAASGRSTRFDLAPLQQADLQALLQSLPLPDPPADTAWCRALAAALLAQVGGTPALVLEALKSLWLDGLDRWAPGQPLPVPPTLRAALQPRLQRLDGDALRLVQLAAVAGSDFSLSLAAQALGRPPLAVAPLLAGLDAAQLFQGTGLAHDLVADAVRGALPPALAAALHGLVADHLAAAPGHDDAAARIAHHLQAAGRPRDAVRWHLRAARQARARWQMAAAAQAFEAAAQALDPADRTGVANAWHEALRCWLAIRRDDEAGRTLQAAEALARTPAEQARLLPARTGWLFNSRRRAEAVASAQLLIDAVATQGVHIEPRDLAYGARVVGVTVPYGTDLSRALAMADQVHALLTRPGVAADGQALRLLRIARAGLLHWASRPLDAAADLQAAWPAADARHEAGTRAALANQLMRVQHALGRLDSAHTLGLGLLAEAPSLDLGVVVTTDVMHVVAMIEVALGRGAAGLARWQQVVAQLQAAALPLPDLFITSQAHACLAVGRPAQAARWLAQHPAPGRPGQALQDLNLQLAQARLAHLAGGDPGPWLHAARRAGGLPPGLELQRQLALALVEPPAHDTLPPLLQRLHERGLRGQLRCARMAAARAALAAGLHDAAADHAHQALALADAVDAWIDEPASVWLCAAQVLQACGRHDAADHAAGAGAAWVREHADQWADAADHRAWCQGHPVHRALLAWGSGPRTG